MTIARNWLPGPYENSSVLLCCTSGVGSTPLLTFLKPYCCSVVHVIDVLFCVCP